MNLAKITNKIALITMVLSMYWVFIFISFSVFKFKVFRENMTQVFNLSILGIFAILLACIIINIMFNLTIIAERHIKEEPRARKNYKVPLILFIGSFPVIFLLLYAGDQATTKKKEKYLVSSASDLLEEQSEILSRLSDYSFSRKYLERAGEDITVLRMVEEKFPMVKVIVRDSINGKSILLGFPNYSSFSKEYEPIKANYIFSTSSEERKYLNSVFDGKVTEHLFSSNDGEYEIYYPVVTDKGIIVIHLSQYNKYGKIGS